jgi:hypothetical protein
MPQRYDHMSNTPTSNSNSNLTTNVNRSTPTSSRYFHRAPLMFPPHHQQRLRSPPPRFSSSYLGPLQQHRPRFLSAWDLAPAPTIYHSSRNIAATAPTPTSMSKQHDEGSCILNSCAFHLLIRYTSKLCNILQISSPPLFHCMPYIYISMWIYTYVEGFYIDYLLEQTARRISPCMQANLYPFGIGLNFVG